MIERVDWEALEYLNFKVRCSQIGELLTKPKLKRDRELGSLSQTTKNLIKNYLFEHILGTFDRFSNKYTEKGKLMEQESINLLNQFKGTNYVKNEEFFENDFLTGTPDIIDKINGKVIDIKTSYSLFSFPLFNENINKSYFYQLQGYMELLGFDKAELIYVLPSANDIVIQTEFEDRKKHFVNLTSEDEEKLLREVKATMIFEHIPLEKRIKIFEIEKEDISNVKDMVEKGNEYLKELINKLI